jgi:hypothetical protein
MSEPGIATVVCYECDHEVEGVLGSLGVEDVPDEGRIFYSDPPFKCSECGGDTFTWLEFWAEKDKA